MEWLYVTAGMEAQEWMVGMEDVWRKIEGRRIIVQADDRLVLLRKPLSVRTRTELGLQLKGTAAKYKVPSIGLFDESGISFTNVQVLTESSSCFIKWCKVTGADAAIIRPDRYVYAEINRKDKLIENLMLLAEESCIN